MNIDLEDFGFEEQEATEETTEEATEQQEQEPVTPEKEEPKQEEKPAAPKVDHGIPPRQRIEDERAKLKFEATVFGDMNRQASKIVGDLILWEFDNYPEREQEWDYNEWTLVDFLQAFADKARQQCTQHGNQALFAGRTEDPNDPTMGLIREIIHTKNEPPKKPEAPKAETKPKEPKVNESKVKEAKAKSEPKKDHEQLELDLGDF